MRSFVNHVAKFILFFFLSVSSICKADLGYIQIKVLATNLNHKTEAVLKANDNELSRFSHSISSPLINRLNESFLNSQGKTTPIVADYTGIEAGCEFDYELSFSYDQKAWISLGHYHVPNRSKISDIPIGLCGKDVCSNLSPIQNQIEVQRKIKSKERSQTQVENLATVKRQGEDKLRKKIDEAIRKPAPQMPAEVPLDQLEKVIEVEKQIQAQDFGDEAPQPESADQEFSNVNPDEIRNVIQEQMSQTSDPVSVYLLGFGLLDLATNEFITQEMHFSQMVMDQQVSDPELLAMNQSQMESMRSFQENVVHMGAPIEVAKLAGRFAASEVIDACELLTQKEYCQPNGRVLTKSELTLSAMGLFVSANRDLLATVTKKARIEVKVLADKVAQFFRKTHLDTSSKLGTKEITTAAEIGARAGELDAQIASMEGRSLIKGEIEYRGPLENIKGSPLHETLVNEQMPQLGSIADTFRSQTYLEVKLTEDLDLYRVYANETNKFKEYWSLTKPSGPLQITLDFALDPRFGNPPTNWVKIRVPKGNVVCEGLVSDIYLKSQSGKNIGQLLGGGSQVYILNGRKIIKPSWIIEEGHF